MEKKYTVKFYHSNGIVLEGQFTTKEIEERIKVWIENYVKFEVITKESK